MEHDQIPNAESEKCLGLYFDSQLLFEKHISVVSGKVFIKLRRGAAFRGIKNTNTKLINSLIMLNRKELCYSRYANMVKKILVTKQPI